MKDPSFPCTPAQQPPLAAANRELKPGKDGPCWGSGQGTHAVDLSLMLAESFGSGGTLGAALVGGYLEHFSLKRDRIPINSWHQTGTLKCKWSHEAWLDLVLSAQKGKVSGEIQNAATLHCLAERWHSTLCVWHCGLKITAEFTPPRVQLGILQLNQFSKNKKQNSRFFTERPLRNMGQMLPKQDQPYLHKSHNE